MDRQENHGVHEGVKLILEGQMYSKANSRQLVFNKRTRKPMVIKNAKALKAMDDFILQMKAQWNYRDPMAGPIRLIAVIYYQSNRSDLDDSLLCDCLQKAKLILNDNQLVEKVLTKRIDPKNPRVEFSLVPIE